MSVSEPQDHRTNPFDRIRPLPPLTIDGEGRFWDKVDRSEDPEGTEGCWWWTARRLKHGYGQFSIDGQMYYSHRVSFNLFFGDPGPLILDHRCGNGGRGCVHPMHVVPMTQGENALSSDRGACAINARKTHCKWGHEFTAANTLLGQNPNGRPKRICRACRRIRADKVEE